jgi:electron transfer flavoprotein beta subunit
MKIVVCIKAVPASTEVRLNPETNTLIRSGIENIINPFDNYALDLALRIKEKHGAHITVISMGIPDAKDIIHHVYSLGADKAILLTDRLLAGADTLATSYSLASAIKTLEYDLILCGKQSTDGDTAQVGPEMAEILDIPHLTYISKIKMTEDPQYIISHRRTTEKTQFIYTRLPAVLTVVKGDTLPQLPTLKSYLNTLNNEVEILTTKNLELDDERIGLSGSPTQVVKVFTPKVHKDKTIIEGTASEKASQLIKLLNLGGLQK